jgi:hypothetical protein
VLSKSTFLGALRLLGDQLAFDVVQPFRVSEQLGHSTPKITFSVYHRAVKRRDKLSGVYAEQFDRALDWAEIGGQKADKGRKPEPAVVSLADARTARASESAEQSRKLNAPGA